MTETTESTTPEITDEQFKGWIGEVLDERLATFKGEVDGKLSKLDILDSLGDNLSGILSSHIEKLPKGESFDKESFLSAVGNLIDSKLASIGSGGSSAKPKRVGPIGRWLTGGQS